MSKELHFTGKEDYLAARSLINYYKLRKGKG